VRRLDRDQHLGSAEDAAQSAAAVARVDHDLEPVAALAELDARVLDHGPACVVVTESLEDHGRLFDLVCLEADLTGAEADVEPNVSRRLEDLGPHRGRLSAGLDTGRCGRRSTRTSTCPNGIG
jgi:hypothetical protein